MWRRWGCWRPRWWRPHRTRELCKHDCAQRMHARDWPGRRWCSWRPRRRWPSRRKRRHDLVWVGLGRQRRQWRRRLGRRGRPSGHLGRRPLRRGITPLVQHERHDDFPRQRRNRGHRRDAGRRTGRSRQPRRGRDGRSTRVESVLARTLKAAEAAARVAAPIQHELGAGRDELNEVGRARILGRIFHG